MFHVMAWEKWKISNMFWRHNPSYTPCVSLCVPVSQSDCLSLVETYCAETPCCYALLLLFTLQAAFTCGMTVTLTVVSVCCVYLFTCGSIVIFDSWLGMFPSFWRAILSVCQFLRAKQTCQLNWAYSINESNIETKKRVTERVFAVNYMLQLVTH